MMHSLQSRLLLAVGVVALAAVASVSLAVRQGTREEFVRLQDVESRSASARTPELAATLAAELDGRCCEDAALQAASMRLPPDTALVVLQASDAALVGSAGLPLRGVRVLKVRREGRSLEIEAERGTGPEVRHIGLTLQVPGTTLRLADGRQAVLYLLPFPGADRARLSAEFFGALDRRLLLVTVLVAFAALLATWLLARGIVAPLGDLRSATRSLALGEMGRRVVPRGGAEVAELGRAFNAMAEELQRQHALRRDLVHDVAHELRSPLTALRCRLEAVLDGLSPDPARALNEVREEVLHLGRLVDDLQELALAEARELRLDIAEVALDRVIGSALRAAGLEGSSRLRVYVSPGVVARGDVGRIRQVVLNLLTNAARYTPEDGAITVHCATAGGEAIVEVANTGSHLTPAQVDRLFDRFYRTDPSRQRVTGGTGLGLAIVKHLVEAQGGRVWARSGAAEVTVGFALPIE